ncbi:hypothetical protein A2954_00740 [Candidatus Roizmanbacteria bacterium RIFCSPLOWO2_01_FULL_37_12]|uniref:DUF5659 domain-containing protein n=1 Tax=Candidatus Roizmanbacteria bacterium RIFCSPLOWO2_01_FULL_37_12 TaxID=1802056 RepID=A0A1F7IDT4_9BACT|nr:MAG: hypothetical protein A2954_00740 [Candidatus Roizmanbacteria bacterium RIFCSPLOWO2_01_FULL_37_12]
MENKTINFSTSDIKVASFILSKSVSLIGTERPQKRKVVFLFERTPELLQLISDYLTNKALVNPRLLFESFDNLKRIIFKEIEY